MIYSHPRLKRLYNQYNKKYFGGRLPKNIVVAFGMAKEWKEAKLSKTTCAVTLFELGTTRPFAILIRYWKHKGSNVIKTDLLHELCHVSKPRASHGPAFRKELRRLMMAGAFDKLL